MEEFFYHAREVHKFDILPDVENYLPRSWSSISRSMYVSLSAGIKIPYHFEDGTMGLCAASIVPCKDVCIGLCPNLSNSL